MTRRDVMKLGLASGAATIAGNALGAGLCPTDRTPVPIHVTEATGCGYNEVFPTSPFILDPFTEPLPVPKTLRPGWRLPEKNAPLAAPGDPNAWFVRESAFGPGVSVPGPEAGRQDALGERPVFHAELGLPPAGTHQLYPGGRGSQYAALTGLAKTAFDALAADPILFHIRLQVDQHRFTGSRVVNIDKSGAPVTLPLGAPAPEAAGTVTFGGTGTGLRVAFANVPAYRLPPTTIYGFNGTFPGPMVNAMYGKPVIIRFENDLDINPGCLDRQDFGAPDWAFLTHLHNGHTAPESDGNPHHLVDNEGGYIPGQWSDNLYLMYAAGGDEAEKQSFLWFHDHRMHHTGPNVYKGMVGLMPHYDPILDSGDETTGLRLPGKRTDYGDGSFDVDYDLPLALYDCIFEDGLQIHRDFHQPQQGDTAHGFDPNFPNIYCGNTHPEWWGKLFLQHYPNHGFVGDVFTTNCVAYPVHTVERRRYRLRFLGASLARCYDLSLRQGTPMPFPGMQGQWNFGETTINIDPLTGLPDPLNPSTTKQVKGIQVMKMMQIASEGGLLPRPIVRDSIEIWPAKRREVIVDFSVYQDGTPTTTGDAVYLTNTMVMLDGRKPTDPGKGGGTAGQYAVPLVKFIIGGLPATPDLSVMPRAGNRGTVLRPAPVFNANLLPVRTFTLSRGGTAPGLETEWLINNMEFDPLAPLAFPRRTAEECWAINNGGGGWTHPMHIHMEEHHVTFRSGTLRQHPDDTGKEDVVALDPSEQTNIVRRFRTFLGNYVAHCHNLAHEDHNMMFGWTIVP